jgi:hypothetical protein
VYHADYNSPAYLIGIERSGIGKDGVFCADYVNMVKTASSKLFRDLAYSANGVHNLSQLSAGSLNCPKIKKEQLSEWLYTAYYLLDRCCVPLMGLGAKQNGKLEKLKDEKIDYHEKIIQLQTKLIEQKDQQLNDVKETVTTELKSYSSVVQESCSAALAPRNIVSAVKNVTESEDRSRNVVVFGLPEEQEENLDSKVNLLLEQLDEKPLVTDCRRIGQKSQHKPGAGVSRPIRFKVKSSETVYQILRKAKQLMNTEGNKRVFISPDRTIEERVSRQKLVKVLKEKRSADPNKHFIIRKGEVVCLSETQGCVVTV